MTEAPIVSEPALNTTAQQPHPAQSGGASTATQADLFTARVLIDESALIHNAQRLAELCETPMIGIVKADAYGHGLSTAARALYRAGVRFFGVAQAAEALRLRQELDAQGIERSVRILSWIYPPTTVEAAAAPGSGLRALLEADIDLAVGTARHVACVRAAAEAGGRRARIHLMVDTGMTRAGSSLSDGGHALDELAEALVQARAADAPLEVVGLCSHLAQADVEDPGPTQAQCERFEQIRDFFAGHGIRPQFCHLAATAGALWWPRSRYDMVRIGIGLYGASPNPQIATGAELGLIPVMTLSAQLTQVRHVAAHTPVSYGGTWSTPTERWIGLVPVGYSDGISRLASHGTPAAHVSIRGVSYPVVGRICMDQFMVDLGPARGEQGELLPAPADVGDEVIVWGNPAAHPGAPSVDEWSQACDTISYEMMSRVGARLPRISPHELPPVTTVPQSHAESGLDAQNSGTPRTPQHSSAFSPTTPHQGEQ